METNVLTCLFQVDMNFSKHNKFLIHSRNGRFRSAVILLLKLMQNFWKLRHSYNSLGFKQRVDTVHVKNLLLCYKITVIFFNRHESCFSLKKKKADIVKHLEPWHKCTPFSSFKVFNRQGFNLATFHFTFFINTEFFSNQFFSNFFQINQVPGKIPTK